MAVKNTAQVIIGGKIITLGGYESEEYFQQVASYMNKKIAGDCARIRQTAYGDQAYASQPEHYRRLLQGEEAGGDL